MTFTQGRISTKLRALISTPSTSRVSQFSEKYKFTLFFLRFNFRIFFDNVTNLFFPELSYNSTFISYLLLINSGGGMTLFYCNKQSDFNSMNNVPFKAFFQKFSFQGGFLSLFRLIFDSPSKLSMGYAA